MKLGIQSLSPFMIGQTRLIFLSTKIRLSAKKQQVNRSEFEKPVATTNFKGTTTYYQHPGIRCVLTAEHRGLVETLMDGFWVAPCLSSNPAGSRIHENHSFHSPSRWWCLSAHDVKIYANIHRVRSSQMTHAS